MNDTSSFRFPGGLNPVTQLGMVDNINCTIDRCVAIADLIQAVSDSEDADAATMDGTIGRAATAIIGDLEDLKVMVSNWNNQAHDDQGEDDKREMLRESLTEILRPEFPNEEELSAEVDKRMSERLEVEHG